MTKNIHLFRQLEEHFRESRDLHMILIAKAYDKVSKEVLWWILMKKGVLIKYVNIIKYIYDRVVANIRTCGNLTNDLLIAIGLY